MIRIIVLLLFTPLYLIGQEQKKIDSIQQILLKDSSNTSALLGLAECKQANLDTDYYLSQKIISIARRKGEFKNLTIAYNRIGVIYFFLGVYDTACIYFRNAYNTAAKHNIHFWAAKALTNIGQTYVIYDKMREAIDTLLLARQHLQKEDNADLRKEQTVKSEYLLGEVYSQIGLYDNAIETLLRVRRIYDQSSNIRGRGNVDMGLSNAYLLMKDNEKAIEYLHLALNQYTSENDSINKQKAQYNLGHAYILMNNFDSALYWYNIAISRHTDNAQLPFLYELRASIFRKQKQSDSAISYYRKALALHDAVNAKGRVGECFYEMGCVYYDNREFYYAIPHFQKATMLFQETELLENLVQTYFLLAGSFTEVGNYKQAIRYYQVYDSLHRAVLNQDKVDAVARHEIKYETTFKEAQIAKQQSEIALRTSQNNWLTGGVSFASVAIVIIGFAYMRIRKQRIIIAEQKQDIIHHNRNSIQRLASIFEQQGKEGDYKDIAAANRERLFALQLLNRFLYDATGKEHISMNEYLMALCEAKEVSYDIPISLQIEGKFSIVKTALVRDIGQIINELTTNAAKYAFDDSQIDKKIEILIAKEKNMLKLKYQDHGKGLPPDFDIAGNKQSFGLSYIKDLVAQHGGTIKCYNDGGAHFEIMLKM